MLPQLLRVWPLFLLLIMFSACTRYQYATVSSPLKQNLKREFVHENDSIRVVYNFHGAGGPVQISVHNKLDTPVFVNWQMSSLIIDGQSSSYFDNVSTLQGSSIGTEVEWAQGFTTTNTRFSGTISQDENVSYIPPGRYVTVAPASLRNTLFKRNPTLKPQRKSYATLSGASSGRSYNFDRSNSPLHYQSYLSYSTDAKFSTIATVEDDFWVSEILETFDKPNKILNMEDRQADTFYNSKLTGFGGTMAVFGLIVLVGINAALQQ